MCAKGLVGPGCKSHDQFKRSLPHRLIGPRIVRVLCNREPFTPVVLCAVGVDPEKLFYPLIATF